MRHLQPLSPFVVPLALLLADATAQCANAWVAGDGCPGTNSVVNTTMDWDPDGPGPASPVVVIAGGFSIAGDTPAKNIVAWDPATGAWTPFGAGLDASVFSLATLANGDLVVGGAFATSGGNPCPFVARWDGATWTPVGGGTDGHVNALTMMQNGDLVIGGRFTAAGGVAAARVARWDGSSWSALGSGCNDGVMALKELPTGDLLAGGRFTTAGGVPASSVARWDGTSWSALGAGITGGSGLAAPSVASFTMLTNGDVLASGFFAKAGGATVNSIARWNGAAWAPLGTGILYDAWQPGSVAAVVEMPNGEIVVGGSFTTAGGANAVGIARWNGAAWSAMAPGETLRVSGITALANGDLVVGGVFTSLGGVGMQGLARWNGVSWSPLQQVGSFSSGFDYHVQALATLTNGDIVAGGGFAMAGGSAGSGIARWNGTSWSQLGGGTDNAVLALATMPNGDLLAAGAFTVAGGVAANRIARWNGASWSALGTGCNGSVEALLVHSNGDVIAGGRFTTAGGVAANYVARWNGTFWSALGAGLTSPFQNNAVSALAELPNGDIAAGGSFTTSGTTNVTRLARWDGASWSALGGGITDNVKALCTRPDGNLIVGANNVVIGGGSNVGMWDGASWSSFGAGVGGTFDYASSLALLPNGDLVVGGYFTSASGVAANHIARWDGAAWSPLGAGLGSVPTAFTMSAGGLVAGGHFVTAGGFVSPYIAEFATSCPAAAAASGSGCSSSGGGNTLAAVTLPWVDGTFHATGTGLPTTAIVLALTSVWSIPQGAIPLTIFFPQAGPSCDVLVAPDILQVYLTTTGSTQSELLLPNVPPLVGVTFFHQMVPIEVDVLGNWVSVTATNALQLTAGMF